MTGWPRAPHAGSFVSHPFAVLEMWDGRWYGLVAEHGYVLVPGRYSDAAFFPLFPLLLHGAQTVGLPYRLTGVLLMNAVLLGALILLYELGREWLDEPTARRAAVYAALLPPGFVFSMLYPESLALALMALGGLFAVRGRWLPCAVCAALSTLTRPEGIFLALPIAAAAAQGWPRLTTAARGRALAAVLAGPAMLVSLSLYMRHTVHDPLVWTKAQHAWGRQFRPTGVFDAFSELFTNGGWLVRDAAFCLLYCVCLGQAWRARIPAAWVAAGVAMVLLPLASGSFTSDARFGLLALPVYWGLAVLVPPRRPDRFVRIAFTLLLVAGAVTIPLRFP